VLLRALAGVLAEKGGILDEVALVGFKLETCIRTAQSLVACVNRLRSSRTEGGKICEAEISLTSLDTRITALMNRWASSGILDCL